jgi:6-phosphogluconate dehydrogenase
MPNKQSQPGYEIGMVGLGVMGRNFLLNLADHGFAVAAYDRDPAKVAALRQETKGCDACGAADIKEFIAMLRCPRAVMLLVPTGPPVDSVINDLLAHLQPGDLIIDAGNSYFKDTDARAQKLEAKGIQFLGVGISEGELGHRRGPSIMPGGPKEAYERVRRVFESAAAQFNAEPCVTYLGPGSAGHFVKMIHHGIEYGLMQLMSETYDLMKRGLGLDDEELHEFYAGWNHGELKGYLLEITGNIFSKKDEVTGRRLIDEIRGVAKQLGIGMWTSLSALELEVPIPTIDSAVAVRNLSVLESERAAASAALPRLVRPLPGDSGALLPRAWRC